MILHLYQNYFSLGKDDICLMFLDHKVNPDYKFMPYKHKKEQITG